MKTLQNLFDHLPETAQRPFLISMGENHQQSFTYEELAGKARQLACGLIRQGLRPGQTVGLFAPIGFSWTVACTAVLLAGGVIMPLDLQMETKTLTDILDHSRPEFVFAGAAFSERLRKAAPKNQRIYLLDGPKRAENAWGQLLVQENPELPEIGPDHWAVLFYTSGTTGHPKGVPLSHRNLMFQIETVRQTGLIRADDRVLMPLPTHHVYPFVIGVLVPLSLGIAVVIPYSLTGPQLVRALNEGYATILFGVPRLYEALINGITARFTANPFLIRGFNSLLDLEMRLRGRTRISLTRLLLRPIRQRFAPQLRIMASGGAPLDPKLASKIEAMGWQVAIGYGLTETAPLLTLKLPGDLRHHTVGQPVKGVQIRIDQDAVRNTKNTGVSGEGEILAKGPNIFSGYADLPEPTRTVFTEDDWFHTGDLGFIDEEGYLHVSGRISTMIITPGGENIQPDDIESHLCRHPLIREAGVLQLKNNTLAAVIMPDLQKMQKNGIRDLNSAVKQAVFQQSRDLPSYQRLNDVVITRSSLPRTRMGKIRRHRLEETFKKEKAVQRTGKKHPARPLNMEEMADQDRTLLDDTAVKSVWDYLAKRYVHYPLSPDISPELDLGVDSLEWLTLTLEIRERAGVELDDDAISKITTIRDLLEAVAKKSDADEPKSRKSPFQEPEKALSPVQRRWLNPLKPFEYKLARGLFWVNRLIFTRVCSLQSLGIENIPESGPFIITPNHVSYLDAFALAAAMGFHRLRRTFWAGFVGVAFTNPFNRYFSRLARVVPIDPVKGKISNLAFGAAVLNRGRGLVWFPEGERSPDGRMRSFKPGIGLLLEHYRVPVIPARIQDTEVILPRGKAVPRPGRVTVIFGDPRYPDELAQNAEGTEKRVRIARSLEEAVRQLGNNKST